MNVYFRYSYRKHEIAHLIRLTDSFSWEDLPTRDPDTGYLTKAGYLRLIPSITKYLTACALALHCMLGVVRMQLDRDMVFTNWYPFDVSASPAFEIANFTQVMLKILSLLIVNEFRILYRNEFQGDENPKSFTKTLH
jgi:hypothetical protein